MNSRTSGTSRTKLSLFRVPALLAAVVGVVLISSSATRADDDDHKAPTTGPSAREPGRGPSAGRGPGGAGGRNDHEVLEGAMEAMEQSYKVIASQIDDASKDESTLTALGRFQAATIRSKSVLPGSVSRIEDEAKRAEMTKKYRQMMVQVLVTATELEEHLLAGERDAAKESLKELHDFEKSGHDDFRPKRGRR